MKDHGRHITKQDALALLKLLDCGKLVGSLATHEISHNDIDIAIPHHKLNHCIRTLAKHGWGFMEIKIDPPSDKLTGWIQFLSEHKRKNQVVELHVSWPHRKQIDAISMLSDFSFVAFNRKHQQKPMEDI